MILLKPNTFYYFSKHVHAKRTGEKKKTGGGKSWPAAQRVAEVDLSDPDMEMEIPAEVASELSADRNRVHNQVNPQRKESIEGMD